MLKKRRLSISGGMKKTFDFCGVSEQGGRPKQEDMLFNYVSSDGNIRVFGVFDGHSGKGGGDKISKALGNKKKYLTSPMFTRNFKGFRNINKGIESIDIYTSFRS